MRVQEKKDVDREKVERAMKRRTKLKKSEREGEGLRKREKGEKKRGRGRREVAKGEGGKKR
jgi:hypothetical protein